jgi:hypothetical protein
MSGETVTPTATELDVEALLEARKLRNEENLAKLAMVDLGVDI